MDIEKIVYFLGAGFSAPFGLPVMSNFIEKSKDLYFSDPNDRDHFQRVHALINEYSVAKNLYATNLHNIEEVLSILESRNQVDGTGDRDLFVEFIRDVIKWYTPEFDFSYSGGSTPSNWQSVMWGTETLPRNLGVFVASLVGMTLQRTDGRSSLSYGNGFELGRIESPGARYGLISMNYDLLIESCWEAVKGGFHSSKGVGIFRPGIDDADIALWAAGRPTLAKLHGSIDGAGIVPPTWNKTVDDGIRVAWKKALQMLRETNHIRFIGYSMPTADAYVKYLLKAAAVDSPHLKSIDVICLDPTGEVKARYDSLISFPNYRFFDATLEQYLLDIDKLTRKTEGSDGIRMDKLEIQHTAFVRGH